MHSCYVRLGNKYIIHEHTYIHLQHCYFEFVSDVIIFTFSHFNHLFDSRVVCLPYDFRSVQLFLVRGEDKVYIMPVIYAVLYSIRTRTYDFVVRRTDR